MAVKVVIIGAGGFLGFLISRKLVGLTEVIISPGVKAPLGKILLFDVAESPKFTPPEVLADPRVSYVQGDLLDKDKLSSVVAPEEGFDHLIVFHLAGILSGQGEKDFDLCLNVNLYGSLNLLDALRKVTEKTGHRPVIVFTSTNAVFVQCETITDTTPVMATNTYGITKGCIDLLLCDYTRKGFLDARIARLPSIIGRPEANTAASNAFSAIFRDTLAGKDFACPIPLETLHPCSSPSNLVNSLLFLSGEIDADKLGHNRIMILPAKSFTVRQMWETAQEVAKEFNITMGKVTEELDPSVMAVVKTWPPYVDNTRAIEFNLPNSIELKDIITDFAKTYIIQ